ncbi:hypothetical protein NHX12_026749 [Muraenolepis orangiensis]|uniref:Uncharacterized protein n=1 Tax=Muraenolepis orangiensis TaxID=630683 RepID=A0A9Q0EFP6_9TELE|nr:hypothetical protein NHX12_026749 [Muraenolepis orangiensis]
MDSYFLRLDFLPLAPLDFLSLEPLDFLSLEPLDFLPLAPLDFLSLAPLDFLPLAPLDFLSLAPLDFLSLEPLDFLPLESLDGLSYVAPWLMSLQGWCVLNRRGVSSEPVCSGPVWYFSTQTQKELHKKRVPRERGQSRPSPRAASRHHRRGFQLTQEHGTSFCQRSLVDILDISLTKETTSWEERFRSSPADLGRSPQVEERPNAAPLL